MKKCVAVLATVLLVTVLFSCGKDYGENDLNNENIVDTLESDKTTITLGIIDIHPSFEIDYTMQYVSMFNRENAYYEIEVTKYTGDDLQRLRTELMNGRGPDLIYSFYFEDSVFMPLMDRGLLVDLWAYIDADPDINREDYFQNILHAMQSPNGSLQIVANQFAIPTIISIPEIIDSSDSFTTSRFLDLMRNALDIGVTYPMGEFITGSELLIFTINHIDMGIIDLVGGVSDFESKAFYDLLELASIMPAEYALTPDSSLSARMINGDQLFRGDNISNPYIIAKYEALLREFTILGFPSDEGGTLGAVMMANIGINANSSYQDAAWSFVRMYLLSVSNTEIYSGLPLRIDLFDEQVTDAMRVVEVAWILKDGGFEIEMPPLTEKGAEQLREIVENVSFISRPNDTIANIVMEELPSFLAGNRTIEEVVRVIQNRVQIYLHERS